MTTEHHIEQLTTLFSAIADKTRLRIILFVKEHERRSSDIATHLDMSTSAISHQLRWLREKSIVDVRQIGREKLYSLTDQCIHDLLEIASTHINERQKEDPTQ